MGETGCDIWGKGGGVGELKNLAAASSSKATSNGSGPRTTGLTNGFLASGGGRGGAGGDEGGCGASSG